MSDRIARWNERYANEGGRFDPSPLLAVAVDDVAPGRALDLACGTGRHAIALAERGWRVLAVDAAVRAVELMAAEAARRGVADRIEGVVADLEAIPRALAIEREAYDLVCDFYFLDRALFPEIRDAVRPGGRFVAAIHVDAEGEGFRFAPGELRAVVGAWDWEILYESEGRRDASARRATAEIVARKP
jgi:SAM-dependent methyltransferase